MADAFALWTHGTHETAAHLAGLSAECALKSILVGLRVVVVAGDGQIESLKIARGNKPWRVHIDKLWGEFQSSLTGRSGAVYAGLLPASLPTPYDGWLVDHRYIASAQLTEENLERWMWAAIMCREVLQEAANRGEAQ